MKSNEQQSPVDEYFRQHEAEIPVNYNPENWSQLTALLDAAEPDGTPKTPPTPVASNRLRFRGGKGWWVSGVWILTLTIACWVIWQTDGNSISEKSNGILAIPADLPAASSKDAITTEGENKVGNKSARDASDGVHTIDNQGFVNGKGRAASSSGSVQDSVNVYSLYARDSVPGRTNLVAPADSTPAEKPPVKKKKHLFW